MLTNRPVLIHPIPTSSDDKNNNIIDQTNKSFYFTDRERIKFGAEPPNQLK